MEKHFRTLDLVRDYQRAAEMTKKKITPFSDLMRIQTISCSISCNHKLQPAGYPSGPERFVWGRRADLKIAFAHERMCSAASSLYVVAKRLA